MPYEVLQYVVGRALTDPAFHAALIQAPEQALASVAMSSEERQVVLGARITSLRALANRIDRWLQSSARPASKNPSVPHTASPYDGFDEFADLGQIQVSSVALPIKLLKSAYRRRLWSC